MLSFIRESRPKLAFSAIEIIGWSFVFSSQRIDDTENKSDDGVMENKRNKRSDDEIQIPGIDASDQNKNTERGEQQPYHQQNAAYCNSFQGIPDHSLLMWIRSESRSPLYKNPYFAIGDLWLLARPRRFERLTHSLEGCCSIQVSYGRILDNYSDLRGGIQ